MSSAGAPFLLRVTGAGTFVTARSLATFAVAAAVLKTLWDLLAALVGGAARSSWTAVALCLAYGAWQVALGGGARGARGTALVSACVVALVNAALLAASVIGLSEARQA